MNKRHRLEQVLLRTFKISLGSCMAIYIAQLLQLENVMSAGTIALLTILSTKWETLKLSLVRLLTFVLTITAAVLLFGIMDSEWMAYGIFLFLIVSVSNIFGWQDTISVNAVIGTHFLAEQTITFTFVLNEFLLLVIGIVIAILLNLVHTNSRQRSQILYDMRYVEERLKYLLGQIESYLNHAPLKQSVWQDIIELEQYLQAAIERSYEYQNNTFVSHPSYYIKYLEMRMKQCNILHSLHYEMKRMRKLSEQAKIIAGYVGYLKHYVVEHNKPVKQLEKLNHLLADMKKEPLPKSREEFESRAVLYHILMELEDFLIHKQRFVEGLSEKQLQLYWKL